MITNLSMSSQVSSAVDIIQQHQLALLSLRSQGRMSSGAVVQRHECAANDLTAGTTVQQGAALRTQALGAENLTADTAISHGGVGVVHALHGGDLSNLGPTTVLAATTAMVVTHALRLDLGSVMWGRAFIESPEMRAYVRMTEPDVPITHYGVLLITDDMNSTGKIQSGQVETAGIIAAGDLNSIGRIQSTVIDTLHNLASENLNATGTIQSSSLLAQHLLDAGSLSSVGELSSGDIVQVHALVTLPLDSVGEVQQASFGAFPTPPVYADRINYIGNVVSVSLAVGWQDADPTDYSIDNLPAGLSMTNTGLVTGEPTTEEVVTCIVSNSGHNALPFQWEIQPAAPVSTSLPDTNLAIGIGISLTW